MPAHVNSWMCVVLVLCTFTTLAVCAVFADDMLQLSRKTEISCAIVRSPPLVGPQPDTTANPQANIFRKMPLSDIDTHSPVALMLIREGILRKTGLFALWSHLCPDDIGQIRGQVGKKHMVILCSINFAIGGRGCTSFLFLRKKYFPVSF